MGLDHPSTKDGSQSKYAYLSPKVFDRFQMFLEDERLLDLKPDIALMEVLKAEAASNMEIGASSAAWQAALAAIDLGLAGETLADAQTALHEARHALTAGARDAGVREEVGRTLERRGRLVKTYQQLLTETGDLIPASRVALVMGGVSKLVREYIKDDHDRADFGRRLLGLVGARLSPPNRPTINVEPSTDNRR